MEGVEYISVEVKIVVEKTIEENVNLAILEKAWHNAAAEWAEAASREQK